MAHTCPVCGCYVKPEIVPTIDGSWDKINLDCKAARRVNHNYNHELCSWKKSTKARKQWARHPHRLRGKTSFRVLAKMAA